MSAKAEQPVTIESGLSKKKSSVNIMTYSKGEAVSTGLKWGAACWGMALVALPIPLVHFIAVPACLLIGPPVAYMMYRMHVGARDIETARLPCPSCNQDFEFKRRPERWPQTAVCPACAAELSIAPSPPSPTPA